MSYNSYQAAISTFHSAIDYEQANNNKEAYKKYAEGLSLIGFTLKEDAHLLNKPNFLKMHKHMLEFAKRSVERLLIILPNTSSFDKETSDDENCDKNSFKESDYRKLSKQLPEIVTNTPVIPLNFPDEIADLYSPLSFIEEENKRIIKRYESRIESMMNSQDKANLQLELQRRLAENNALARKRHEDWERKRKSLSEECQRIAQQKFDVQHKIQTGIVKDTDFTKQNLYAACLQFEKEYTWAEELSHKIKAACMDENVLKITLIYTLQHGLHPLACMLRQVQQKTLHKLIRLNINNHSTSITKNEEIIMEEYFKNIVQDIKEDLFAISTVIQTLWEPLSSELNQQIVIDIIHDLYFPPIKPYLVQLLRIVLRKKEEKIKECMDKHQTIEIMSYPPVFNSVISKLHQLSAMHSPSSMMAFLQEILKSFVKLNFSGMQNENHSSLSFGIDEMMPKLIQLILISKMTSLPTEITFTENFMSAKKALGEEGYTVTLFQSVLSYIYDKYK